jgi:hypothetical protein
VKKLKKHVREEEKEEDGAQMNNLVELGRGANAGG